MGAFFNSICVPGDRSAIVRETLARWLSIKGFEPLDVPILFDLDGDHERSAFLVWNDRWTILFYSHFNEERRLIRELQSELEPVLYVWVQDGEEWGYDIFGHRGFLGTFASNPRSHLSFTDEPLGAERPRADARELCHELGLPRMASQLRRLERRKTPFKEEVCWEVCQAIGAEAAASSYDQLESGQTEHLEGWQVEQRLFVRRDLQTVSAEIDLSRHSLMQRQTLAGFVPDRALELPPEILEQMERLRRRQRWRMRLLKPISWAARGWRALRELLARRRREAPTAEPPPRPTYRRQGRRLVNDRHRCEVELPEGAEPAVVSSKPAAVFAFRLGDVQVSCTARRLRWTDEVLRRPSRATVLADDKIRIGGLKARRLRFELPPGFSGGSPGPGWLHLDVIQAPHALYVFLSRVNRRLSQVEDTAICQAIESFRLLDLPSPQG